MKNLVNVCKIIVSTVLLGVVTYLNLLAIPIIVLISFMCLDYITGILTAWVKHELSSRVGIVGIVKKIMYIVMVAVGIGADWVIQYAFSDMGISVASGFVISIAITIWLIINELISILENVAKINGDICPKFLKEILGRLKNTVDDQTFVK